ncbi:uncharacterized protein BCR38DRAFT_407524 [Pseudomassariella vexata]|uniref:Uncharacterized protein n=1 Tax=Pseudomassariella vexata TaxID=1141098 RepID=A0A1Y2E7P0_9PEZI|nr:uncharacterized protein BCR38DRAFT_407524 [Pseudomassariella vexata]ORY67560.1 hypothetical protein BCR38DRAFT_407524 [Pseudomassariella vexata]
MVAIPEAMHFYTGSLFSNSGRAREDEEIRITIHITGALSYQKYIIKLYRALMTFGTTPRGVAAHDRPHSGDEEPILCAGEDMDVGRLKGIPDIYKEVLHDVIDGEEATE